MKSLLLALTLGPCLASASNGSLEPPTISIQDRDPAVTTRPAEPVLEAPASFARVEGGSVDLSWKPVDGADFYDVQVASDAGFYFPAFANRYYFDTKVNVTGLQPGTIYFWRVAAGNTHNASSYTKGKFAWSSFTTSGTAPAQ